jgi:hypothetical protein
MRARPRKGIPETPGLSLERSRLIAQLDSVHRLVCDALSDSSDSDTDLVIEFTALKESFQRANPHPVQPKIMEELYLRRTEEAKLEGRERQNSIPLQNFPIRDARIQ